MKVKQHQILTTTHHSITTTKSLQHLIFLSIIITQKTTSILPGMPVIALSAADPDEEDGEKFIGAMP